MTLPPSDLTPLSIASCAFSVSLAAMTHDVARLLAVDARDPHAGLLAQPRRDVVLVGGLRVVGVREALVDQLVDLAPRGRPCAGPCGRRRARPRAGRPRGARRPRSRSRCRPGRRSRVGAGGAAGRRRSRRARGRGGGRGGRAGEFGASEEATGGASELQSGVQNIRLHAVLLPLGAGDRAGAPPCEPAYLQGKRVRDRTGTTCCGTSDDKCVAEWDRVGYCPACTAGPGWRGSSHSATSDRLDFTGQPDT